MLVTISACVIMHIINVLHWITIRYVKYALCYGMDAVYTWFLVLGRIQESSGYGVYTNLQGINTLEQSSNLNVLA
jgi:hypothetical protein